MSGRILRYIRRLAAQPPPADKLVEEDETRRKSTD